MKKSVFLWIPNLIGYGRIVLTVLAVTIYVRHPLAAVVCYIMSFVLDGFDGALARVLRQTSRMGAVLDMTVDRLSTAALCMLLIKLYASHPVIPAVLPALVALDIMSHWFRMYALLTLRTKSHKDVNEFTPFLLRIYYKNRVFMALLCIGAELFYIILFIQAVFPHRGGAAIEALYYAALPLLALKNVINFEQLLHSMALLTDAEEA